MKSKIKDILNKKITILFFTGISDKPKTLSVSKKVLFIFFIFLCVILGSSIFIITRYVNYIDVIANNLILEDKLEYFSRELIKNRNYLAELKNIDLELRRFLNIETATRTESAIGGPDLIDKIIASKIEAGNSNIVFTIEEFNLALSLVKQEIEERKESVQKIKSYIKQKLQKENSVPNIWPTVSGFISSGYGYRIHPIKKVMFFHKGIDISVPVGKPVIATADGVVKYANWLGGYGKIIILSHGYGYTTYYAHLSSILVEKGTKVFRGDKIGLVGSTGLSTGPHLHYEIRYNNKDVNPIDYIKIKQNKNWE